jgi:hypothetical protein
LFVHEFCHKPKFQLKKQLSSAPTNCPPLPHAHWRNDKNMYNWGEDTGTHKLNIRSQFLAPDRLIQFHAEKSSIIVNNTVRIQNIFLRRKQSKQHHLFGKLSCHGIYLVPVTLLGRRTSRRSTSSLSPTPSTSNLMPTGTLFLSLLYSDDVNTDS